MVCFGLFGGGKRRNAGSPEIQKAQAAHVSKLKDMQRKQDADFRQQLETVAQFSELFSLDPEALPTKGTPSLISLSELDVEGIRQLEAYRRRANGSRADGSKVALFAPESDLRQFVCDSLLRKHSLSHLVDLFAQAAEEGALPEFCQDITPKDIVIGLLLGSPPDELGHLIALLCQGNSIVPLCWPVAAHQKTTLTQLTSLSTKTKIVEQQQLAIEPVSADGPALPPKRPLFNATLVNWDSMLYLQTAKVVKTKEQNKTAKPKLLVWHGTAVGKTQLLQQAELTNASLISQTNAHSGMLVASDDLTKGSLVHRGSIDLAACSSLVPGLDLWIADVHSHQDARLVYDVSSFVNDVSTETAGAPATSATEQTEAERKQAAELRKQKLQEFRGSVAQASRGVVDSPDFSAVVDTLVDKALLCLHVDANDFDPETGEVLAPLLISSLPKASVVVWRDFDPATQNPLLQKVLKKNPKLLQQGGGSSSSSNPNGTKAGGGKNGTSAAAAQAGPATVILLENMSNFRSQAKANAVVKQFRQELAQALHTAAFVEKKWPDIPSHLDLQAKFEESQQIFELQLRQEMQNSVAKIKPQFGMQEILEKLKLAEEQERNLSWQKSSEMQEHIELAQKLADKSSTLQKNREKYFLKGLDHLTLFFLEKLLLAKDDQKIGRLLVKNTKLAKAIVSKAQVDRIKTFAARLEAGSEDFTGMESFWNEIQMFYQCAIDLGYPGNAKKQPAIWTQLEKARLAYGDLVTRRGAPMQLLAGNPLAISSQAFLANVLRDLDQEELLSPTSKRKLRVISVIGAQSSAKSTLMNFLFGSEFAVSAGRCTCGLYASVFFTNKSNAAGSSSASKNQEYAILVLDSEGLLGVSDSSRGDIFDGQMTLMCLNCSHVVLINHKGELSRQLQDLIEICLFAMRHLKINKNRPKIGFVLRDQQDRSVEVHRQMLATMKNHLHESAGKLGIALDDLIKIDDTAVYLLPSAYVTVRKHNVEVQWTPELFSQEVLALRSSIFEMFESPDMENVWENLEQWYSHTCHVWDTLVRFGHNLLHYKTIQEIEARKDLYELAKQTTQLIMEEDNDGFRAQCQTTTNGFIKRLQDTIKSDESLSTDMIDLEFHRALTSLRDDFVQKSMVLFNQKANLDPRFHETMKEEARKKLGTPMDWVFENYLYTWKLSLKKKTDEQAMHKMWTHFTSVLNQYLADSSHQASLSESKARDLFSQEWNSYESEFQSRLASIAKSENAIQYELIIQFNNVVSKLMHEGGPFALLQEQGPQYLWKKQTLLDESDADWEKKYFHDGWRAKIQRIIKGEKASGDKTEYNLKNLQMALDTPKFLTEQIIPKIRAVVKRALFECIVYADEMDPFTASTPLGASGNPADSLQDMSFDSTSRAQNVDNQQMMDESMIIDWFRQLMDIVTRVTEKEHLSPFLISLKRPQFIHELSVLVRVAAYEKRLKEEEQQNAKEMDVLREHKQQIEDHFLLIIKANSNDVEVAKNFATRYHQNIKTYIQQEILNLSAEIRESVLADMPDPAKAYERAYQQSFGARNYQEVLEYVLDVNAYVEKLFLIMFARRKAYVVDTKVASLRERVRTVYKLVLSICDQWSTAVKRLTPGGIEAPNFAATKSSGSAVEINAGIVQELDEGEIKLEPKELSSQQSLLDSNGEREEKEGTENVAADQSMSTPMEELPAANADGIIVGTGAATSSTSSNKTGKITLKDLKGFVKQTATQQQPTPEDLKREANDPGNAEFLGEARNWKQDNLLKAYKVVVDRIPETAEFPVRDAQIFCSAFRQHLLQLQENLEEKQDTRLNMGSKVVNLEDLNISIGQVCPEVPPEEDKDKSTTNSWIDDQLQKGLQEQSKTAWGLIKGCSARCPLCGSKCDQVGEHARHRCTHHLFPAFHGWMDRQNGFPSFHYCKSKEAFEGTYQCNDGEWRPLEVFLRETHEAWLPFGAEEDVSTGKDISLLQSAWVNCKVPLLEYFKPMVDEMPSEWDAFHEPERALVLQDLRKAKDVIRKVRERRFIPEDHYKNLK
ncbi:unnamed protein product [Amoebophrya sp. A120]|nr:unnamed protein product [Amoebophrya sp. A120]|eukprot:GSA120T00012011001.1